MIKLALNLHKFNNYAFFCPVSRLHVTVSNPVGYANEVTTAILRALKSKTLLDVDGVIDIETGTVKNGNEIKSTDASEDKIKVTPHDDIKKEESKNDGISKQEAPKTVDNTAVETSEEKPKRSNRKKTDAE